MAFAFYEEGGTPAYYFYETNIQGDIVAIWDESGWEVVNFKYNAWGESIATYLGSEDYLSAELSQAILFRYRGYIYDDESGFYYLQSRYYDPEIGRFLNADGIINANGDLIGYNLYAYCSNNPVMYVDPTGEFAAALAAAASAISVPVVAVAVGVALVLSQ